MPIAGRQVSTHAGQTNVAAVMLEITVHGCRMYVASALRFQFLVLR